MCLILIADTHRPTDDLLEKAERRNGDGAGIAWREDGYVRWRKGIALEDISQLCETLPLPYIVHFRIVTVGKKMPELCHPFPIDFQASVALEGQTKGHVLFHNGTWHRWKDTILDIAVKSPLKIPLGKWSDSRAMAWSAAHFGIGFLEFVEDKCVVFGPENLEVFGTGWSTVSEGIWVSNRAFEHEVPERYVGGFAGEIGNIRTMCRERTCAVKVGLDTYGYCPLHSFKTSEHSLKEKPSEALVIVNSAAKGTDVGTGGDPTESPFVKALKLFKAGKISKKQFKRMKHAIDENMELPVLHH